MEKLNCQNCRWWFFDFEMCIAPIDPGSDPSCWVRDDEVTADGS